jgi:response regulator RpfG family c-di-GMP phosphodiesterase
MLNGRIMIVSDRQEVIAELEPIIRAGEHLVLAVPDGEEALRTLEDGLVPDVMISDLGSPTALEGIDYVFRFRELNRIGRHMVVVEDGAPFSKAARPGAGDGATLPFLATPLPRPFRRGDVTVSIENAIARVDADLRALRGEMWREMQRMQRAMREMQRETVKALAATVAARDPYMHGHATRVAELCRAVATELRLSEERIETIETAALLHEIGKASVPLELLHKTGALSPQELEQIRGHAKAGADIVAGVPSLRRVAPLIEHQGADFADLHRHFAPDSADFLLAGVLRVVDAYDAMASARSYRAAMTREYSEATLRDGAGTRFHPVAVDALLRVTCRAPRPADRTP